MMVPSLSTSISSPSFFKNREGENDDDQEQQQQLQDGDQEDNVNNNINNNNNNVEGGVDDGQGTVPNFGDLSDLLIPSLNIPELLDELNQHSDTCSNHSLQQQQQNILSTSTNSNKSTNSIGSAGKRSLGYQIYRTFPYRGSLPSPLMQIINQLGDEGGAPAREEGGGGEEKTKPKPCSTNALRHSRQYKGLQLNLPPSDVNTIDIITNPSRKSQELKALSPRSGGQVLDSSFFQPPPLERNINASMEAEFDDQSIRGSVSYEMPSNGSISITNSSNNIATSSSEATELRESSSKSKWSELVQSLEPQQKLQEESSLSSLSLDSLKNLDLDGISLEFKEESAMNGSLGRLDFDQNALSSISMDLLEEPSSSSLKSTTTINSDQVGGGEEEEEKEKEKEKDNMNNTSINNSPPVQSNNNNNENNQSTTTSPPLFIDSRTNAYRIKGQLEMSGDTNLTKKKPGLSRTITFADSESIHHFFGDPTVPQKPYEPKQLQQQPPTVSERDRPGRISLSSLFPRLPFNSNNNPTSLPSHSNAPSKFYYPLLQPQPTTLIRGFASKADTNIRGLKRAKKNLDMEDEWLTMHPFGDDPQMALFAIFDGHSGKNCAVAAKEILPNVLLKYIQTAKKECGGKNIYDMRGVFLSTFKETDALLSKYEYEGATATIVLIWRVGEQRFLQSANVGDSSAFLSYAGETLTLTKDHRLSDPEEQQRIRDDGIELGENQTRINGLMVSRALGDHFIKHLNCGLSGSPTISPPISLTPFHSHLIVASDGLWDVISGNRALEMIKTEQTEEKMASLLLQCALKSIKSKDNISIIVSTL